MIKVPISKVNVKDLSYSLIAHLKFLIDVIKFISLMLTNTSKSS